MITSQPLVGVVAVVLDNSRTRWLMGRRSEKNPHEPGKWCFPGGNLEMGETIFNCAIRETWEETGLLVNAHRILHTSEVFYRINNSFILTRHYVLVFVECSCTPASIQTPRNMEPDKQDGWRWFEFHERPEPLIQGQLDPIMEILTERVRNR